MPSVRKKLRSLWQPKQGPFDPASPDSDKASQPTVTSDFTNASPSSRSSSPPVFSSGGLRPTRKADKSLNPPVFPDGIEVWHDCENAAVDICFIHGLTGDRNHTWTSDGQSEPWPKKLLPPKLPNARILTYGYDAYVVARGGSGPSSNRLSDHGQNLISDLAGDRAGSNAAATRRPIIFVTHSLGGLVCKKGLLISRASGRQDYQQISEDTRGVIFMGTPHRGSWLAGLAEIPVSMLRLFMSSNKTLLDVLGTSSEFLDDINNGFFGMVRDRTHGNNQIRVQCFFEEMPTVAGKPVVPKVSATIDGYSAISIHANHRNMVKFWSHADTGFVRVWNVLSEWVQIPLMDKEVNQGGNLQVSLAAPVEEVRPVSVDGVHPVPLGGQHPAPAEEVPLIPEPSLPPTSWQECLQSLAFPTMRDRFQDIEPAASGTCMWFLEHPTYKRWMEIPQGLLWIMGNPGVGKSTLTKYALKHGKATAVSEEDNPLILSFFVHARGDELQKTPAGLFRALLHQILLEEPHSLPQLIATFDEKLKSYGRAGEAWRWHQRELSENLKSCLPLLVSRRPVWIYIDALDELGKDNAIDIVQAFKLLLRNLGSDDKTNITGTGGTSTSKLQFRLCFSCRYFPIINNDQSVMEINVAKENGDDIAAFVEAKLCEATALDISSSQVPKLITKGANGVFLWASLVVGQVLQLHREGAGLKRIEAEIHAIPKTLETLYQEILRGMGPDSLWLIQWVCFATRSLRLDELQWALAFNPENPQLSIHECRQSKNYVEDLDGVWRQIRTLSCGLVELISSDWANHRYVMPTLSWSDESPIPRVGKCYTAQFIHQSVKEFFLDHGLKALDKTSTTPKQAIAVANLRLTKACLHLLTTKEVVEYHASHSETSQLWREITDPTGPGCEDWEVDACDLRYSLINCFPMLDYALLCWGTHAKQACAYDRSVIETGWPFELWTSAILIEMENRLAKLMSNKIVGEFEWRPGPTILHLSVKQGLKVLLEVLWDRADSTTITTGSPATIPSFGPILSTLVEEAAIGNHEDIMRLLLNRSDNMLMNLAQYPGVKDLPSPIDGGLPRVPISWAALHGNLTMAKMLCERGLIYHPDHLSDAVCFAARQGHTAMVRFLFHEGASPVPHALEEALIHDHKDIALLLLDQVCAAKTDRELVRRWLVTAARFSKIDVLRLVLDTFLEFSDEECRAEVLFELANFGYTGSKWASRCSDPEATAAAQIVIHAGQINVDWTDGSRSAFTPLQAAARLRDVSFLQLLLEAGADLERSDDRGRTALIVAVGYNKKDNVALLLEMGANPNHVDHGGLTPLLYDADIPVYELLLEAGADIEFESPSGETALLASLKRRSPSKVRFFASRGANMQSKPLVATAVQYRMGESVISLMLDKGADIDLENGEGQTALTISVERYDLEGIRYLASRGANMRSKPLVAMALSEQEADKEETVKVVKLLLELGADVEAPYEGRTPWTLTLPLLGISLPGPGDEILGLLLKGGAKPEHDVKWIQGRIYEWERCQNLAWNEKAT
ncbi:hypothetical protein QBC45DRAFT_424049 [Copromyces sp. CBS 386.78]|nr:hypothetical protein QBC45DRAFT_424049 [Copromyces sp. CBS 386.78]